MVRVPAQTLILCAVQLCRNLDPQKEQCGCSTCFPDGSKEEFGEFVECEKKDQYPKKLPLGKMHDGRMFGMDAVPVEGTGTLKPEKDLRAMRRKTTAMADTDVETQFIHVRKSCPYAPPNSWS